ncbi:hypothetical protein LCGC14_2760490 [marine sediment metagenome]|uniref:Uncharacterized protein n=1 Tax=marine sediment metagenome TaxID=412755 RepID=A0A0F8ZKZ5_9ZZZZ
MTFRDSNQAFEDAIKAGRLSTDRAQANYAGNYMYMGTPEEQDSSSHICGQSCRHVRDLFKNIETRQYDV